jgi:hypothetical protein
MKTIFEKNPFHPFGYRFKMFWTCFRQLFSKSWIFFAFSLKCRFFRHKPNSKGILSQCRYTDTKHFSSLKPSALKNKPSQTRRACHFAPPTATCVTCAVKRRTAVTLLRRERSASLARSRGGLLSLRAAEACCHFAPPRRAVTLRRRKLGFTPARNVPSEVYAHCQNHQQSHSHYAFPAPRHTRSCKRFSPDTSILGG